MPLGNAAHVGMVRHHAHDVDRQHACLPAVQQVGEAMRSPGHGDQHAGAMARFRQRPVHREMRANRGEVRTQRVGVAHARIGRFERHPHEEEAGVPVGILLAVGDETAALGQELADRRDNADAIGADQGQHPG